MQFIIGRWVLGAGSRSIGVGRLLAIYRSWTFLLFQRHEFHPAFWTISRMISYDFGMHYAGVLLRFRLLACGVRGRRRDRRWVLLIRATVVSRPYLGESCKR